MIEVGSKVFDNDEFTAKCWLSTSELDGRGQLHLLTIPPKPSLVLRYEVPEGYKGTMTPSMLGWHNIDGRDFIDSFPEWSSIRWVSKVTGKSARLAHHKLSPSPLPRFRGCSAIVARLEEPELGSGTFVMISKTRRRNSQWLKIFRMMEVDVKRQRSSQVRN
jgi:hypothetical protein